MLNIGTLPVVGPTQVKPLSNMVPTIQDIALVVPADCEVSTIINALYAGGGELLERVELFDRYTGKPLNENEISYEFTLTFRAGDRTLTAEEAGLLRDAAVGAAAASIATYREWHTAYRAAADARSRMLASAGDHTGCLLVHYSGSGSPEHAMAFGNDYARRKFAMRLGRLYSDATFYDIWQREFHGYDRADRLNMVVSRMASGGCVLMHGMPLSGTHAEYARGMDLENLATDGPVTLYRLRGFIRQPTIAP